MILAAVLTACGHISDGGSFQDNCEEQGGSWGKNPNYFIEVPVIKDGTVVTVKKVATQEYCQLPPGRD